MQKKKKRSVFSRIRFGRIAAVAVVVLALGAYFVSQATHFVQSSRVVTEPVVLQTAVKTATADAFIIRKEAYITGSSGNIVTLPEDGDHVASGEAVAYSFTDNTSAENVLRRQEISRQLDYYIGLRGRTASRTANSVQFEDRIFDLMYDYARLSDSGSLREFDDLSFDLRDMVTSEQTAVGEQINVDGTIQELQKEYDALSSFDNYESILAPEAGYYVSYTDGYEGVFDYDSVENMTPAEAHALFDAKPVELGDAIIGKVITRYNWYIVTLLPEEDVDDLGEGDKKNISFPYSTAGTVSAVVRKVVRDSSSGRYLIIFSCNSMSPQLCSVRHEKIIINMKEYTGYRIHNAAYTVSEDNKSGVYVLNGHYAQLKKVRVIYSDQEYSIVRNSELDSDGNEYFPSGYISLYDNCIIKGKNIYDGKYIG